MSGGRFGVKKHTFAPQPPKCIIQKTYLAHITTKAGRRSGEVPNSWLVYVPGRAGAKRPEQTVRENIRAAQL